MKTRHSNLDYHLMLLPGTLLLLVFSVVPMFGIVIAFQKFVPAKGFFGSQWVGLDNILFMFQIPDSRQVFVNTVVIAVAKIVVNLVIPLIAALLLNEVRLRWYKRAVQTVIYMPHFLSWVVFAAMIGNTFSYDGFVNNALRVFDVEPILFLSSNVWFRPVIVFTDAWKSFGFGTVIYLGALTAIDPALYESASIDGAKRFQQLLLITLPGIVATVILMMTLSLGNILNAGFEQILNLYNPLVYSTGDIIDTYVYRVGLVGRQYGIGTAVGLLKSVVSFFLIWLSYGLASRYANYRIF